MSDNFGVDD